MENQLDHQFSQGQTELPNATAVLVLGIISIVGCICYGIVGLVLGIIALVLASNGKKLFEANPGVYSPGSYGNMKAGKICAIIGVSLSAFYFLIMLVYLVILGSKLSTMPWENFK